MRGAVTRRPSPDAPAISSRARPFSASLSSASTRNDGMGRPASVLRVLLRDDAVQLGRAGRLHQALAKLAALEQAADSRQRLQVGAGRILGSNQDEEDVRRAAVHRLEIDALAL